MADEINVNEEQEAKTPTVEELMAELAKERSANSKQKAALDKALKETGELKKSLRAKQTADEAEEADRKAREQDLQERYEALLKESTLNKHTLGFKNLGFTDDQATKAATALADNDTETLFEVLGLGISSITKTAQANWLNNRPPVNSGVPGATVLTKEQFEKMDLVARTKLKRENPDEYARLRDL